MIDQAWNIYVLVVEHTQRDRGIGGTPSANNKGMGGVKKIFGAWVLTPHPVVLAPTVILKPLRANCLEK